MTDAPPNLPAFPSPPDSERGHWSRPATLRQLQLLGELAEIGLEIARAVERQAAGAAPATVARGDFALAYARVSRSVRQTIHLQSRLIDGLKAEEDAAGKARAETAEVEARGTPEYRRKARVERIVERLAMAEHLDDEDEIDALIAEAGERLDDEDLYGDLMDRPVSELVARICQDLGLQPDWSALAAELWAQREIKSGQVGWPLLESGPTRPPPLAGEAARRAGGGIPPPRPFERRT